MLHKAIIILFVCLFDLLLILKSQAKNQGFYERPGVSAREIAEARGYAACDVYLSTPDRYRLHLTRVTNPLIKQSSQKRVPILLIHGILEDSNAFVINSFNVEPRDWSHVDLASSPYLNQISADPSSNSLPFLAANFGHEIWLLDRRGAPGSQKRSASMFSTRQALDSTPTPWYDFDALISAPSAFWANGNLLSLFLLSQDSSFWDYSFDEQAKYDFPLVLSHISEQNGGEKVAVVAHSAGGSIVLMALAEQPDLANIISSAVLWSPGFAMGLDDPFENLLPLRPFLEYYIGPVPPAFSPTQIQAFLGLFCAARVIQRTVCESVADLILGSSGGKEPIRPEFLNSLLYSSSSHELAQILQGVKMGNFLHKYNYGSPILNEAKYGRPDPPAYDLSRVTLTNISLYVGRTDYTVSETDVKLVSHLLKVPHRFHLINTTFNHQGYFFHDDTAQLAIVPTLWEIQTFASS